MNCPPCDRWHPVAFSSRGRTCGIDLGGCASELDTLRRRADDASDAAQEAQNACDEYEDCRSNGDDDCSSQRETCEDERDTLRSDLEDVESAIREVQVSCGYTFQLDAKKAVERLKKHLEKSKATSPSKPVTGPNKTK
jgi:chromosome segregation ATPase